jgi:hypothetical protein
MFPARLAIFFGLLLLPLSGEMAAQNFRLKSGDVGLRLSPMVAPEELPLRVEATPRTHWLDFRRLAANRWIPGELPDWLDPVTTETTTDASGAVVTIFRLPFRGLSAFGDEIQFRIFFDDRKESAPTITAWSEKGALRFTCGPLGAGLGLPTSETLNFPTAGTDRLEIQVPGDGRAVRGIFLAILASQQVQHAADFAVPADVTDAFGNVAPLITKAEDQALFGRVRAMLDATGVRLAPDATIRSTWEFPLESPPLLAVVTFEVLHADALAPLEVILNDRPLGPVGVHWPDLADPGYLGLVRPLEADMRFRYTGWLRCQKVIPGSALRAGANALILQLHPDSGPLAVRAVELSLKYPWKSLDYTLSPVLP